MTTQARQLHSPQSDLAAATAAARGVQTRLPWWAVALPALGFAALLALLSGAAADASTGRPTTDLLTHITAALSAFLHHLS